MSKLHRVTVAMRHLLLGSVYRLCLLPVLTAVWFSASPAWAGGSVASCTEDDLLVALQDGGDVYFDEDCNITLSGPLLIDSETTIDGAGNTVILSGGATNQIIRVVAGGKLTLIGLTLSDGLNTNGGAIYVGPGAVVVITNCILTGNKAVGDAGTNGIAGSDNDQGNGGDGRRGGAGSSALGGAIYNLGDLTLLESILTDNSATGGNGGSGGNGGNARLNGGKGGGGAAGGAAMGGAIYSAGVGTLTMARCTCDGNTVVGGDAGSGGSGGTGLVDGAEASGAIGGVGSGAAVYCQNQAVIAACTFSANTAEGGNSTGGGMQENGNGFTGFVGGASMGGGLCLLGSAGITNCTFASNKVTGGSGGDGGSGRANSGHGGNGGAASGAGLYSAGYVSVVNCTFYKGAATGGTNGLAGSEGLVKVDGNPGVGRGGGVANGGGVLQLMNSLFATNAPGTNVFNLSGTLTDGGYNLSSDKSSALTSSTSLKNTDPKILTLASNGGPTMTLMLATNSPAIDRIPLTAFFPAFDQREVIRPIGKGADIGAVEVSTAPAILTQPASQWQTNGGSVVFEVEAIGEKLKYQWRTNGVADKGATAATYQLTGVTITNAVAYDVVIHNSYGSITSRVARLYLAPYIALQPLTTNAILNNPAVFSVIARGSEPMFYQWFFNQTNLIPGATATNCTIPSVTPTNEGYYSVVITNVFSGVTSTLATLSVILPPTILIQPVSQAVAVGSTVTLSVTAEGSAPLKYQWNRNSSPLSGVTSSSYVLTSRIDDSGDYDVNVSGPGGSIRSAVATLSVLNPVAISGQTASPVTLSPGQSTNLSVTATGDKLSYQWQRNGTNLIGATNSTFAVSNAQLSDAGTYSVLVSNAVNVIACTPISLIVRVPPFITRQPASTTVSVGAKAVLTVSASGADPLAYKWFKGSTELSDGGRIGGATSAQLVVTGAQAADAAGYTVVVTNAYGSVTSAVANLTVSLLPAVVWDPLDQTNRSAAVGDAVTLTVQAYGEQPLLYLWFKDGQRLTNAPATNALTLNPMRASDVGSYVVVVTNVIYGSATTAPPAVLNLGVAPYVVEAPTNQSALIGASVTFTVTAGGTAPLVYQWQKNGVPMTSVWFTTNAMTLSSVQAGDDGSSFSVTVSNVFGCATSAPAAELSVIFPPSIAQPPTNQMVVPGSPAWFAVTADGTGPFGYQWRQSGTNLVNGPNISGAASNLLSILSAQSNNAGAYSVVITNPAGAVTSAVATLTLRDTLPPNLTITSHTNGQAVPAKSVVLTGTASDVGRGGSPIVSVTVNGVRATNDTATGQGVANWSYGIRLSAVTNTFTVVATDGAGDAATQVIQLLLDTNRPTLTITSPSKNQQWSNATFTVVGTAKDNLGVSAVFCQLNGSNWVTADGTTSWTLPVQLVPGTNTVRAFAQDRAGNRSSTNTVVFAYNRFLGFKGAYSGLFSPMASEPAATNSGLLSLSLTDQGKFTGQLRLEGASYSFSGSFTPQLQAQVSVKRAGKSTLTVALELNTELNSDQNVLTGLISSGSLWQSGLLAYRADTSRANVRAGSYTLLLAGCDDWGACFADVTNVPNGDSPASVKLSASGAVTLSGTLASGATISQSAAVSEQGYWPLYVSLNSGRGMLFGRLSFDTNQAVFAYWLMPPGVTGSYYTNGFGHYRAAWLKPWLKTVNWTNATAVLTGGNLPVGSGLTNRITYSNNVFRVLPGGSISNLTLSATSASGLIKGTFINPLSRKSTPVTGVLEQRPETSDEVTTGGWWLGPKGEGGNFRIFPE